jgi:uncharacterized membrane protein HdeD (DUF308 family)
MQQSARHLLLIIGSVLVIFGGLVFFLLKQEKLFMVAGGIAFVAGALMVSRAIKNPQERKSKLPDIRKRYKRATNQSVNAGEDEIH